VNAVPPLSSTVTVCMCTYRRASVDETLRSVAAQRLPSPWRIKVVVADNDETETARGAVEAAAARHGLDLAYVHAPARNISRARNACLDACESVWAAFIDDDETAAEDWLAALLATATAEGAGAVLGPVVALYDDDAPGWMRRADLHTVKPVWVGGSIRTGYAGNVLLRLDDPALAGLRFDEAFGRSGGEDSDFFTRYTRRGGSIAFAEAAIAYEAVPAERARLGWLLRRRFRMGQTHADILTRPEGGAERPVILLPKAAAKFLATAALGLVSLVRPEAGVRHLMRAALHLGVVARLLGVGNLALYGRSNGA